MYTLARVFRSAYLRASREARRRWDHLSHTSCMRGDTARCAGPVVALGTETYVSNDYMTYRGSGMIEIRMLAQGVSLLY